MQQLSRTCQVADHKFKAIEYVCVYPQCKLSRFLCSKCTMGANHKHNQQDDSYFLDNSDFYEQIKKNLDKAKGKQQHKKFDYEKSIELQNYLKGVQNMIQQVEQINKQSKIKEHEYEQFGELASQQLEDQANLIIQNAVEIKEWRLSEVVINQKSLSQQIKVIYQKSLSQKIKDANYQIQQIDDTGDSIILTVSSDKTIMKIYVHKKQYCFKILAHDNRINGLDYNKSQNIIASGSDDTSIKLWNGNDGSLIIENKNDYRIKQVLFNINNNQQLSSDFTNCLKIWNINYQTKQLEQL